MVGFLEKLRVSNFLSFFGEFEIHFKPFTAVMCNFHEGKEDFFRAFEFVFGAKLSDLGVKNPLDLVQKSVREEFLVNHDVKSFVEITLSFPQENKYLTFCRSIKKGPSNSRMEYKVAHLVTTSSLYEEKLHSLGWSIRQKNLIFYKSYFDNVIWGSSEDLEMIIFRCLREEYLLDDWIQASKKVAYLTKSKTKLAKKNYYAMKRSHSIISNYAKKIQTFHEYRETNYTNILLSTSENSSNESIPSLKTSSEESSIDFEDREKVKLELEMEIETLREKLHKLNLEEACLTSYLYHQEMKLAAKPVNISILENRISNIKMKIQYEENRVSDTWNEMQTLQTELEELSRKKTIVLVMLQEKLNATYRQNRFTRYGRFCDYLQPGRYVHLLKQIIGLDIFYANLTDTFEDSLGILNQIKELPYEHREVFISFETYSHKLKDTIIASGEKGVQLNSLEDLLIFLCKLKHYELIDDVPVIAQRNFDFDNVAPENYIIYLTNNIHFMGDGVFGDKNVDNDFCLDTEKELLQSFHRLDIDEEITNQKLHDLVFIKWKTLININSLENDLFCFKQKWRKSTSKIYPAKEPSPVTEIYKEYSHIFKEYNEEMEMYEKELQQQEPIFGESESSTSSVEESVSFFAKNLEDILLKKRKIEAQLKDSTEEFCRLNTTPLNSWKPWKNFVLPNILDKTTLFFEKELKKLRKLMREDDLEDFLGNQEWRKIFISSLIKDLEEVKVELKTSVTMLQNISTARKRKLYQLFEQCNRHLSHTFNQILSDAIPFVKMEFGFGEEKIHLMSSLGEENINIVDIYHFNTLIKFISALSVFLELAEFEKIPLMLLDDIEDYFPLRNDNLEAVLDCSTLEKILPDLQNPRFHLFMRLGQFLKHYIEKNSPKKQIRNNGSNIDYSNGPTQIIYFAKGDFIHAADHFIWIQSKMLPEEYISDNINSYSVIQEINMKI